MSLFCVLRMIGAIMAFCKDQNHRGSREILGAAAIQIKQELEQNRVLYESLTLTGLGGDSSTQSIPKSHGQQPYIQDFPASIFHVA